MLGLHLQGIQTKAAVADLSVGSALDQSFHLRITLIGCLGVGENELTRLRGSKTQSNSFD